MPSATPNTPSGSSRKRSACDSQLCEPTTSSEAITVSNSRLICATEEPNRVGTISRMIFRTSGWRQPQRGRVNRSSCRNAGNWNSNCRMPAARIAQPIARIGVCSFFDSHSAPAIMHRLRITGVNAGSAKRWKLFSAPPDNAVSETNSRNGKVSRSSSTVSSNLRGSSIAPGENNTVTCGAKMMPSAVISSSTPPSVPDTRAISSFSCTGVPFSFTSVKTGTKAVENEPSANSRRMKLGMRNATQNASVAPLAPNAALIDMSRTRPSTREIIVMLLKESSPRSMLGDFMGSGSTFGGGRTGRTV